MKDIFSGWVNCLLLPFAINSFPDMRPPQAVSEMVRFVPPFTPRQDSNPQETRKKNSSDRSFRF